MVELNPIPKNVSMEEHLLKKEEILIHYSHYRLEESIVADSFILPTYSSKEIQTCINEIQLVDEK